MLEERMELRIGAPIIASDGSYGHLEEIVLDVPSRRVTGLVVREDPLIDAAQIISIEEIDGATDEAIHVRMDRAGIAKLPRFFDEEALHEGQTVRTTDHHTGYIVDLLAAPNGEVHHLVIQLGHLNGREVVVPVEAIWRVDQLTVTLKIDSKTLESLPLYRPDADILADLEFALLQDSVLREMERYILKAEVSHGIAILSGHVATQTIKLKAGTIAAAVPGVLGINNRLAADPEVQTLVAQAIGQEPRLHAEYPRVGVQHGVVILSGEVSSAEAREIVGERAASVPQVRGVLNYLRAPGVERDERTLRVLQPQIGQEVFTADASSLGHVIRVIISAKNRLVVGIVVETKGDQPIVNPEDPITSREIILSASAIELVSVGGVFLSVFRQRMVWADTFGESDFDTPPADWTPPYPYCTGDIVFSRIER